MRRLMLVFASCAALMALGSATRGAQPCDGGCHITCPNCHNCCVLKAECGKEEKSCWEIECEEICIPCVVFPWQKWKAKRNGECGDCAACDGGCDSSAGDGCGGGCGTCCSVNNGARVKVVKKLKKKTYECPKCKYEWTPSCCGQGSCRSCGPGTDCTANCCDAGCCDAKAPPAPETKDSQGASHVMPPTVDPVGTHVPLKQARQGHVKTVAQRSLRDN